MPEEDGSLRAAPVAPAQGGSPEPEGDDGPRAVGRAGTSRRSRAVRGIRSARGVQGGWGAPGIRDTPGVRAGRHRDDVAVLDDRIHQGHGQAFEQPGQRNRPGNPGNYNR